MRDGDDEADAAEVVASGFVVARGDRSPVFELAERAFGDVSQSVSNAIVAGRIEAACFGRDHGLRALGGEEVAHVVGVVGLVADQPGHGRNAGQQGSPADDVVHLPATQHQGVEATLALAERVALSYAGPGGVDRLVLLPPLWNGPPLSS